MIGSTQQIHELIFEHGSTTLPNLIKQPKIKCEEIVDQGEEHPLSEILGYNIIFYPTMQ